MKKIFLLCLLFFLSTMSIGQIIYSENFNSSTLFSIPTGWKQYNLDGLTVNKEGSAIMGKNAWSICYLNDTKDKQLFSTGYYTSPGTSNDWAVTPAIIIPDSGKYNLRFDVMSLTDLTNFWGGYEIYISTTGDSVQDFTGEPVLVETNISSTLTTKSVDLSNFSGDTIYVAFRNNTTNKYLILVDNIVVKKVYENDLIFSDASLLRYNVINTENTIALTVQNNGGNVINSLTLDWNDGESHTSVLEGLSINPAQIVTIEHPIKISYPTVKELKITISITHVNHSINSKQGNISKTKSFNTVSELVEKNILFEEGTGTWCGNCPRGMVAMKKAAIDHPTGFIGIAIHNQDPMAVSAYDKGAHFSAFPMAQVDRVVKEIDPNTHNFDYAYSQRIGLVPPVGLSSVNYVAGSIYTFKISAVFKTNYAYANIRLGAIISEDNVKGTTTGYYQQNYFSAEAGMGYKLGDLIDIDGSDYYKKPAVINAVDMVYPHVGRALLGGYAGQIGSVPHAITDGTIADYTFTYTVPSDYNPAEMDVTIVAIDQTTGEILNAKQYKLSDALAGLNEVKDNTKLNVYPNPTSDVVTVSFEAENKNYEISLYDLSGRMVLSNNYSNLTGSQSITLPVSNVAPGNYLISVSTDGVSYNQHVVIK